jgi:cholesterol transport system auxiliary component
MKKITRIIPAIAVLLAALLANGCATGKHESATLYDLGLLRAQQDMPVRPALPPLSIAEVNAPAWLDSQMMYFRLTYANEQQPRPYASSRWSMSPAQLFGQRLKARIGQAGGAALSASDGVENAPLLRIEADDFTQLFESPGNSVAQVSMRAAVLKGRTLVAQKTFMKQSPAPTADAAGGARALADASDAIITDMMNWLAGLPLKK